MIRLLISLCLLATAIGIYLVGAIQPEQLQITLQQAGGWAPIAYIVIYVAATVLILPSTALNLAGGAIFGPWLGTLWTSIAAVMAAVIAFIFTRTIGRDIVFKRIAGRWQALDAEIQTGGLFYIFAIRLQPIIPYGLVNFAAGLTSIRFKDFFIGTALGTVPGIFPFVLLGSFGLKAIKTGEYLPLLLALLLLAMLITSSVWYYRRRTLSSKFIANSNTRKSTSLEEPQVIMTTFSNGSNLPQRTDSNPHKKQNQTFEGFDFLRAVFAIAIVALHCYVFFPGSLKIGAISIGDILRANVAYLAVPVFFQISLFLFYRKSEKAGSLYLFQKRLPKLISLYLFWVGLLIVFNILLNGKFESLRNGISSIKALVEFVVSGGNSPLYFFFSLAFITVIAEALVLCLGKLKEDTLKNTTLYILLGTSCMMLTVFSFLRAPEALFENMPSFVRSLSSFSQWAYNPLNFLPYIFTTAIAVREYKLDLLRWENSKLRLKLLILIALFLTFTILEWVSSQRLLHYSRLSLVFGSWILLYLAILSNRAVPKVVQFISGCSLGIYTLHLFFTYGLFENSAFTAFNPALQSSLNLTILFQFGVALLGSISLTVLFRQVKFLKGFV